MGIIMKEQQRLTKTISHLALVGLLALGSAMAVAADELKDAIKSDYKNRLADL